MSWINKIFTIFQNDTDEVEFEKEQKQQPKSLNKKQNQKKEIEAKVLYQYPKTEFRFPLIPDEKTPAENTKRDRPKKTKQSVEIRPLTDEKGPLRMRETSSPPPEAVTRSRPKPSKSRTDLVSSRQHEQLFQDVQNIDEQPGNILEEDKSAGTKHRLETKKGGGFKYRQDTKKDGGPSFKQPFKPTEIPSPIYAFNRPPARPKPQKRDHNQLEEIEYELTDFDRSLAANEPFPERGMQKKEHEAEFTQENFEKEDVVETLENKEAADIGVRYEDHHVSEYSFERDQLESQYDSLSELDSDAELQAVQQTEVVPEAGGEHVIQQRDIEVASTIRPENRRETADEDFSDFSTEEQSAANVLVESEEEHADLQQVFIEEKSIVDGEEQLPAERPIHSIIESDGNKGESNNVDNVEARTSESLSESNAEEKGEEASEALEKEEPQPSKARRQLPFNVLMLKQDKKKWEERKSSGMDLHSKGAEKSEATRPAYQSNMNGRIKEEDNMTEHAESGMERIQRNTEHETKLIHPSQDERAQAVPVAGANGEQHGTAKWPNDRAHNEYEFPPIDLLNPPVFKKPDPEWLAEQEEMLNETLKNFNVGASVVNMTQGPSVTRFELRPEPGVKVNKITNLTDDIKLSLAAKDIRIEAPIPGKHTIGIEVPNHQSRPVLLSEILQTSGFLEQDSPLSVALGLDIEGKPIVTDLKKMPHGLIAGATGSGKSVCINTMLVSLLYKANPDDVKLLLIDPKMVELAPYNHIPHLVSPVITDVKAATASLKWAVEEMERRYELFAHTGVRDIHRFNELAVKHRRFSDKLPYIVIVIDELADLMMMAPADVEEAICRIAQKARACGIHLIIATQRPSVDVITGLIKANVPTRIAFSVSSQVDSRTIIDISGAEKLLGRGDMLFLENGSSKPFRLQGTFVTDREIDDIVAFVREQKEPVYLFEQEELLRKAQVTEDEDELFLEACEFVVEQGSASTSSVQRRFKIGYNRAARLIEMMEQQGFISEGRGSKPRDVLISNAELDSIKDTSAFL